MISASSTTSRTMLPREAPTARSRPTWRVRWAIVIEKLLKMMNAPTNSEMPANTSSTSRRIPMIELNWSVACWVARAPVIAS